MYVNLIVKRSRCQYFIRSNHCSVFFFFRLWIFLSSSGLARFTYFYLRLGSGLLFYLILSILFLVRVQANEGWSQILVSFCHTRTGCGCTLKFPGEKTSMGKETSSPTSLNLMTACSTGLHLIIEKCKIRVVEVCGIFLQSLFVRLSVCLLLTNWLTVTVSQATYLYCQSK